MRLSCLNRTIYLRLVLAAIIAIAAGCSSTPEIKPSITAQPGTGVINYALSLQGAPYRYGKASPEEGFDCSGFVMHVYGKHGVRLPRTANDMASALPAVPPSDLSPGDLVFFNTSGRTFSHVGIFINNGKFIHAPSKRTGHITISSLNNSYWRKHFTGIRRPRAYNR